MPNYECPVFEKTYRDLYKKEAKDSQNENFDHEELESVSELPSPVRQTESPRPKTQLTPQIQNMLNDQHKLQQQEKPKFDKQSRREKIM